MAKKNTKISKAERAEKTQKRTKRTTIWLLVTCVFLVAFLRTGFIFFILAMLPAIVASFVDRSASRSTFHTIFACNLAGTLPFLGKIIRNKGAQAEIMAVMGDAMSWLIIYSAAAFGWLLVFAAPAFALGFINMLHQGQISRLDRMQQRIIAEWGAEVDSSITAQEEETH